MDHYVRPQLKHLGKEPMFLKPWNVEFFGWPIEIGDFVNVITSPDKKIRLTIWSPFPDQGSIKIGNYCLICPGVRIGSAVDITIGDNCMLAHGVYITDCDWHGVYDRVACGKSAPVKIGNNVWLGDGAIVCKGVTIGDNSIIGAGSVVVKDIPANVVAAGSPAIVVRELDPSIEMRKRSHWFADSELLKEQIDNLDRTNLNGNTFRGWLRTLVLPREED